MHIYLCMYFLRTSHLNAPQPFGGIHNKSLFFRAHQLIQGPTATPNATQRCSHPCSFSEDSWHRPFQAGHDRFITVVPLRITTLPLDNETTPVYHNPRRGPRDRGAATFLVANPT